MSFRVCNAIFPAPLASVSPRHQHRANKVAARPLSAATCWR